MPGFFYFSCFITHGQKIRYGTAWGRLRILGTTAGHFDPGGILLTEATVEDKQMLGMVLFGYAADLVAADGIRENGHGFSDYLNRAILEQEEGGQSTDYLVSVQRALIYQMDSHRLLSSKDWRNVLLAVFQTNDVDKARSRCSH